MAPHILDLERSRADSATRMLDAERKHHMPKPNYAFAKRQRELAKKQKKDAKKQKAEVDRGKAAEPEDKPLPTGTNAA